MPDWDENSDKLIENLKKAYLQSRDEAQQRVVACVDLVRMWHRTTMQGLEVPDAKFLGHFRGEDGLQGCEVHIGRNSGVPSVLVMHELTKFEQTLQNAISTLDDLIPADDTPKTKDELNAVIELCAWAHAEWVRIHPFANGNGRTARIWTGFIAMRYGIPPFVRLRPRPDGGYGQVCEQAMGGNWAPTAQLFRRMYLDVVS